MAVIKIKHSTTPGAEPSTLAEGELGFNLVSEPIKAWIGTPGGIKQLFAGADDAVVISPTAPPNPKIGLLWFNSTNGQLYIYYSTQYVAIQTAVEFEGGAGGGASQVWVASTPPPGLKKEGDLWWDTVGGQMYIWFASGNGQWVATNTNKVM